MRESEREKELLLVRVWLTDTNSFFSTANISYRNLTNELATYQILTCHLWTFWQFALFGPFKSFLQILKMKLEFDDQCPLSFVHVVCLKRH